MSIWAKEHVSPTPTTSTVKFLKKSIISRDFLLRQKIRMMGVTTGLSSSSRIKTCKEISGCLGRNEWLSRLNKEVLLNVTGNSNNITAYWLPLMWTISVLFIHKCQQFWQFSNDFIFSSHLLLCTGRAGRTGHGSHICVHFPASGRAYSGYEPR